MIPTPCFKWSSLNGNDGQFVDLGWLFDGKHWPMSSTTGACKSVVVPLLTFTIDAGSWILYSSIAWFAKSALSVMPTEGGPMILTWIANTLCPDWDSTRNWTREEGWTKLQPRWLSSSMTSSWLGGSKVWTFLEQMCFRRWLGCWGWLLRVLPNLVRVWWVPLF